MVRIGGMPSSYNVHAFFEFLVSILRVQGKLFSYGIYITASTDRTVGRLLDAHFVLSGSPSHPLLGSFRAQDHAAGAAFGRVGALAGTRGEGVMTTKTTLNIPRRPLEMLMFLRM